MTPDSDQDIQWMRKALELARKAALADEVPVGVIIVSDGEIVAESFNLRESSASATAHAEVLAIDLACKKLGRWRLSGCTMYVTLEPCVMCAGALVQARVDRVVYGAVDPKGGAVQSLYQVLSDERLNHQPEVVGGVLADECGSLLKEFFRGKRG